MQRALAMAPYFEAHARVALTIGQPTASMMDARQLYRWLVLDRVERFTDRDIYKRMFGHDPEKAKDRTEAACRVLVAHGAIRSTETGRVDSVTWEVHPGVWQVSPVSPLSPTHDVLWKPPSLPLTLYLSQMS